MKYFHYRSGLFSTSMDQGFSLLELLVIVGIVAILTNVSIHYYMRLVEKARNNTVFSDMREIEMRIQNYKQTRGFLPESLEKIGLNDLKDPWGNPYVYVSFSSASADSKSTPKNKNQNITNARKDRNLHPINTDYDLYSKGKDGKSALPLTASISQDDIIRANNGEFIGLASDY